MSACPHCGRSIQRAASACPNCGLADLLVWPPAPAGVEEPVPYEMEGLPPNELTMGLLAGCLAQFFVWCLAACSPFGLYFLQLGEQPLAFDILTFACPLAVGAFTYSTLRRKHPLFARGLCRSLGITGGFFLLFLLLWH